MSKTVECPVKRFKGAVVFKDPLPYLTTLKFERAAKNVKRDVEDIGETFLPVVFESVEEWKLENFPEKPTLENFPGTPRASVHRLVAWLLNELTAIYKGNEDTDPNE